MPILFKVKFLNFLLKNMQTYLVFVLQECILKPNLQIVQLYFRFLPDLSFFLIPSFLK